MKFINKNTGVILEVTNKFVIEQMKKSVDYEEFKEVPKEPIKSLKTEKKSK